MLTSHAVLQERATARWPAPGEVIDMALNHGTRCSERCLAVLERYSSSTSLRLFPPADDQALKAVIARDARVAPENVMPANGSGPLLKLCLPHMIERQLKASPLRIARHLLAKDGYPIYTPRLTYSKVPGSALKVKLHFELIPLEPERGFQLDLDDLSRRLTRRPGLVYLANPNNPTGDILVTREQLVPLLERFPESVFVIDEAYVQYIPDGEHEYFGSLVPQYPNLAVLRSLSFAYGLAAARIGYILADAKWIREFEAKQTPHQINSLSSALAITAINDRAHLDRVRREMGEERTYFYGELGRLQGLEAFPSRTNFILCRVSPPRTGKQLHDALLQRGVRIKIFERLPGESYDEYFRITVGLPEENRLLMHHLHEIFSS